MEKLTYTEAKDLQNIFIEILKNKFLEHYPDTFVKSSVQTKEEYNAANGCMYSWFILICNRFDKLNFSPKYSQTEEETSNSDWSCVKRFIEDFQSTPHWQNFLFQNLNIGF